AFLKDLTQLQMLDLGWCYSITSLGVGYLKGLTAMKALSLEGCSRIIELSALVGMTSLKLLRLRGCRSLQDYGVACLKQLTALEDLDLGRCIQITDRGLVYLGVRPRLQTLSLNECRITDLGLAF